MYKVGLTGGIGSGKSYIARIFASKGIPIYYADKEAKSLMYRDQRLKNKIKKLLGAQAYHKNGHLNRAFVASRIFSNNKLLRSINNIVHPAVAKDFELWANKQQALYVIEESALIFEISGQLNFDKTILVTADVDVRTERVMRRDSISRTQVIARMENQFKDTKKKKLADFIITNNGCEDLNAQIDNIHKQILKEIK